MNKLELFLKRNSSTILTVIGATGVVATAVLSAKAVPKAIKLLDEARNKKGDTLTTTEKIKATWTAYVPAVITGASTIACIFGINYLSVKNQASLMSAYALLDNTYKEYRNAAKNVYGDDADAKIKSEIVKMNVEDMDLPTGTILFFDFQSMRHFISTIEKVEQAEYDFLDILHRRGYATMNEYYALLGLPPVDFGDRLGWIDSEHIGPYGCEELEFYYEQTIMKNGMQCCTIDVNLPPSSELIF